MNNYTIQIIKNQLQAMNCEKYRIGIYARSTKNMTHYITNIILDDIINLIPRLKYENINDKDIFIGQSEDIDRALILVDDLDITQIRLMTERGVNPACVIETSPKNYQIWVSLGLEPMAKVHRKIVAVTLAKEFGGDLACASANHMGRLAGFTNRKRKYLSNKGYPFVRCWSFTGCHADKSNEIRAWAIAKSKEEELIYDKQLYLKNVSLNKTKTKLLPGYIYNLYFDQWLNHNKKQGLDYSLGDFAVVSRMLKEGYNELDIVESLINNSPDLSNRKKNHIEDYAIRTVKAARKLL
ncbi:MAG: RepB family DNA primase [Elusimicrobiota bacterium]|jgi:hypothetical protein|nr:RepB family DNA primase [Elusimicrobiota bacterium]